MAVKRITDIGPSTYENSSIVTSVQAVSTSFLPMITLSNTGYSWFGEVDKHILEKYFRLNILYQPLGV